MLMFQDGGFDKQPYLMFVLFAVTDILYISYIVWSMISSTTATLPSRYSHLYNFLSFHRDQVAQLVCFLLKIAFECLLFARIVLLREIPLFVLLSPVWLILSIIVIDLSKRLYSIQQKVL
ncbi:hypothetical protein NECAME_03075 [Necator americanus]|uniref:Uncharacterized protein n=1 Tax=Necator americanus TaxID=51031 RepID=W2T9I7_NECAM|nr:hypothetical protein NECAME_03075 [Necator americanus]ETN77657.1 hypothetical protein NECAME_03075 [Necator americanus]